MKGENEQAANESDDEEDEESSFEDENDLDTLYEDEMDNIIEAMSSINERQFEVLGI